MLKFGSKISIVLLLSSWSKSTVTWDTQSTHLISSGPSYFEALNPDSASKKVDETDFVKDWFEGVNPNYSFMLIGDT